MEPQAHRPRPSPPSLQTRALSVGNPLSPLDQLGLLSPEYQPAKYRRRSPSASQPGITFAAPPEPSRRQSLPAKLPARNSKVSFRVRSPSPPARDGRKSSAAGGSPPPPSQYENRVSFDTFDNPDAVDYALTLRAKHMYYESNANSRTFLFGYDEKIYSEDALEWLFEELVEDGDEIICLRVLDKDNKLSSGSNLENQEYRAEAHALMKALQDKLDEEKSISLVLEFAVGKVQSVIRRMTKIYDPTCLVVGSRGRPKHGFKNLLPGSISRDCLQNSLVPVLVIPPSSKREKKKLKRQAQPARRSYMDVVERSDAAGSLTMSSIERGRSRNPHPVGSASVEAEEVEPTAPVSQTAIHPRRETTTIVPIPEEAEKEAAVIESVTAGDRESTPRGSPDELSSPDVPILRVNSEDIS